MARVCRFMTPKLTDTSHVQARREVPDLDVSDLVETTAALEVTKLAALGNADIPPELIRQQVANCLRYQLTLVFIFRCLRCSYLLKKWQYITGNAV